MGGAVYCSGIFRKKQSQPRAPEVYLRRKTPLPPAGRPFWKTAPAAGGDAGQDHGCGPDSGGGLQEGPLAQDTGLRRPLAGRGRITGNPLAYPVVSICGKGGFPSTSRCIHPSQRRRGRAWRTRWPRYTRRRWRSTYGRPIFPPRIGEGCWTPSQTRQSISPDGDVRADAFCPSRPLAAGAAVRG